MIIRGRQQRNANFAFASPKNHPAAPQHALSSFSRFGSKPHGTSAHLSTPTKDHRRVLCLRHDAPRSQSAEPDLKTLIPANGDLSVLQQPRHRKPQVVTADPNSTEASRLNNLYRSGVSASEIIQMMKSDGRSFTDQSRNPIQVQVDDCKP